MRRPAAAFAPGRVNLMGDHTDYNDGLCLPFAIALGATVRVAPLPAARSRRTRSTWTSVTASTAGTPGARRRPRPGGVHSSAVQSRSWRGHGSGRRAVAWRSPARCRWGRAVVVRRALRGVVPGPGRFGRRRASPTGWSSHACVREWRTTGWGPTPACSTSSPRSTAARARRCGSTCASRACARSRSTWGIITWPCSRRGQRAPTPSRATTCGARSARSPAGRSAWSRCGTPRRPAGRSCPSHCGGVCVTCSPRTSAWTRRSPPSRPATSTRWEDCSTPRTAACATTTRCPFGRWSGHVERCRAAGALGARLMGGGFGGSVLALFPPGRTPPAGALRVAPSGSARLLPVT